MDSDENLIASYLKSYPGQFVSAKEICRRAGTKRRFRDEPNWALPVLKRMTEKGLLESDATGHFRLKAVAKKVKRTQWVSPQIQRILKQSGRTFEVVAPQEDTGDVTQHYPELGTE